MIHESNIAPDLTSSLSELYFCRHDARKRIRALSADDETNGLVAMHTGSDFELNWKWGHEGMSAVVRLVFFRND